MNDLSQRIRFDPRWPWCLVLFAALNIASGVGCNRPETINSTIEQQPPASDTTSASPIEAAEKFLAKGDFNDAVRVADEILIQDATQYQAYLIKAKVAAAQSQPEAAVELAKQVPLSTSKVGRQAAALLIEQASLVSDWTTREKTFAEMISAAPREASWRRGLWKLYRQQGRLQEASVQANALCRLGQANVAELLSLVRRNEVFPAPTESDSVDSFSTTPLAAAKWHSARSDFESAETCLVEISQDELRQPAVAAMRLLLLAEQQKTEQLRRELSIAPENVNQHTDYWHALGIVMIDDSRYEAAIGMLLHAIEIDPTARVVFQRLSRCFHAIDRKDDAEQFRYRGVEIAATETMGRRVAESSNDMRLRQNLAKAVIDLGRPYEGLEWMRSALAPSAPQIQTLAVRRQQLARSPSIGEAASVIALLGMNKADFPFEDELKWLADNDLEAEQGIRPDGIVIPIADPAFVNVAKECGADFQWYNDTEINLDSIPLYESLGGGIGVIDFDLDGWPDLYFAQGSGRPPALPCTRSSELRRNIDGQFMEVSKASGAEDFHYSSGVSAGDVNQDGFPDLYLGSLQENRLLINNGDGTFRDATGQLESNADFFSTSVAIADVNGDHLPDLFEVNYIENEGAFAQPEIGPSGLPQLPSPALFYAQPDRCFIANTDGTFTENQIARSIAEPGTGLGIVITNLDESPEQEVFIGNDLRANHLLRYVDGKFVNLADTHGVANGSQGVANGCMGIASGDFDRNGTFDMHVGNYRSESDNFFLQNENGTFRDAAASYGLRDISLSLVAFGCKAIDVDRNGWLDLFVTNGHIFDLTRVGHGYKMSPHVIMNHATKLKRHNFKDSNEYWSGKYLGRSMALLDFNRDHKTDIVIGHLESPTALLKNETETPGKRLSLELIGTTSERDAIGTKVTITFDGQSQTEWVTAGDGYLCTDESAIHFAVSDDAKIETVRVNWPSGAVQEYTDAKFGDRRLIIEGQHTSFRR